MHPSSILPEIIQLPFHIVKQQRQHAYKDQIEHTRVEQRPGQAVALHKGISRKSQLIGRDHPCQRSILDQRDDLVGQRRHHPFYHL